MVEYNSHKMPFQLIDNTLIFCFWASEPPPPQLGKQLKRPDRIKNTIIFNSVSLKYLFTACDNKLLVLEK